ncbi:MAG: right-handed parallel beta-helix repeat-containing protein [Spirochaetes bacterium]|nr:right-handed parallel beta-helix repeat-containing protein [Spirochaetota bacterium]
MDNINLLQVTNASTSTNRILFYIIDSSGTTNEYPEYSNDFRIYTPDNLYVNDALTGADIYTTGAGSDITGNGTVAKPYRTIKKVINTYALSAGKRVWIDNGRYEEYVNLDNADQGTNNNFLHFIGSGTSTGRHSTVFASNYKHGFYLNGNKWIRFIGLDLAHGTNGIFLNKSTNIRIESCKFFSNAYGIKTYASWYNKITNNIFSYNTNFISDPAGIFMGAVSEQNYIVANNFTNQLMGILANDSGGRTRYNTITNNVLSRCRRGGMKFERMDRTRIVNNRLYRCDMALTWAGGGGNGGIHLYGSVVSNTVRGNTFGTNFIGIRMDWGTNNAVINNTIFSNAESGIYVEDHPVGNLFKNNLCSRAAQNGFKFYAVQGSNLIMSNRFFDNNNGMEIKSATNLYFLCNIFTNNRDKGLYSTNCFNLQIRTNRFHNNFNIGMHMNQGYQNIIGHNRFVRTFLWGGMILSGNKNRIITNWSYQNGEEGIKIEGRSTNNLILGNYFYTNRRYGIYLNGANVTSTTMINNVIYSNHTGIMCEDSGKNYIYINNIYNNYKTGASWGSGVYIKTGSENNIVDGNIVNRNNTLGDGINIEGTKWNTVRHNYVSAFNYGIRCYRGTNNTFYGNTCSSNSEGIYAEDSIKNTFNRSIIYRNDDIGIRMRNSDNNIVQMNTVYSNCRDQEWWGGIIIDGSDNCQVYKNIAYFNYSYGVNLWNGATGTVINHNTFVKNAHQGVNLGNETATIKNIITYSNTGGGVYKNPGPALDVDYSCVNDGFGGSAQAGTGTISSDPLLKSWAVGNIDFHLKYNSPCQFTGEPSGGVQPAMGAYPICVAPRSLGGNVGTEHEIIFAGSYSNRGINIGDTVYVSYQRYNGTASDFRLSRVTKATSDSTWNAKFNNISAAAQNMQADINLGSTIPARPENVIFSIVTNGSETTNRIVFYIIDSTGVTNEFPEFSNDFRIYTPDNFYVNDAFTAADIYTTAAGNDTTGNGTSTSPYRSISKVLSTYVLSGGKTVWVDNGFFDEDVHVNASHYGSVGNYVRIIGAGTNAGKSSLVRSTTNKYTFQIADTEWIRLVGLDIIRATNGINIWYSTNCSIERCAIYSNGYGIRMYAGSSNYIFRCNINRNKQYLAYPSGINIEYLSSYNEIYSNQILNQQTGLKAGSGNHNIISNNRFINNTNLGIYLQNTTDNRIKNNYFSHSSNSTAVQLYISANNNTLMSNTFYSNKTCINIYNCTNNNVVFNVIGTNKNNAIYMENNSYRNSVKFNRIRQSRYDAIRFNRIHLTNYAVSNICFKNATGIEINNSTNTLIKGNTVTNNKDHGIYLTAAANNIVEYNDSFNNRYSELYILNFSKNNIIKRNKLRGAQWAGIVIQNGNHNLFYTNYSFKNSGNGITLEQSSTNNLFNGNNCYTNGGYGIHLNGAGTTSSTLINNLCYSNIVGIYVEDEGNNRVFNNRCRYNFNVYGGGIYVKYPTLNNRIANNNLYANGVAGNGIYLERTRANVITNNFITHHDYGIHLFNATNNRIMDNTSVTNANMGIYAFRSCNNVINDNECYSNMSYGIYLLTNCNYNMISNNNIYHQQNVDGIKIDASIYNRIINNIMHNNSGSGLTLISPPNNNNYVFGNTSYSNAFGIYLYQSLNNTVLSNIVTRNKNDGLYIFYSTNNLIKGNRITRNTNNGISMGDQSIRNRVVGNYTVSNVRDNGIADYVQANHNYYATNIVAFNVNGIKLDNVASCTLYRNAVYHNSRHGIWLAYATNCILHHNSVGSNDQAGNYDNLYVDANSTGNRVINNIFAYAKTATGYGINLAAANVATTKYNDVYGNVSGPYGGAASQGSGSIVTNPRWLSYNIYHTNFLALSNGSPVIDKGTNLGYPYVAASPDMGWIEFTGAFVSISISKIQTNIQRLGLSSVAIPGATIEYKIIFTIYTNLIFATNCIIYDKMPSWMTYKTDYLGTASAWTAQYSTNLDPNQGYFSTDYDATLPAETNKIKWVRWKKPLSGARTQDTLYYKAIIQ